MLNPLSYPMLQHPNIIVLHSFRPSRFDDACNKSLGAESLCPRIASRSTVAAIAWKSNDSIRLMNWIRRKLADQHPHRCAVSYVLAQWEDHRLYYTSMIFSDFSDLEWKHGWSLWKGVLSRWSEGFLMFEEFWGHQSDESVDVHAATSIRFLYLWQLPRSKSNRLQPRSICSLFCIVFHSVYPVHVFRCVWQSWEVAI